MKKILPNNFLEQSTFPQFRRRLRLGVIGGGRISQTQAMAARQTGYWEIVAGALSSDPKRSAERAKQSFIESDRSYTSIAELAKSEAARDDGVDAVMITTPNHLHFEAAKLCLEAGIDVLCDKPLTNEIEEAQALVDITNSNKAVFGISYVMSCFAMVRQAQEIVASARIGKINQIHVEFMKDWMMPEEVANADHVKWRLDPSKSGKTSYVGDIATHAAHLASFVSGLKMTNLRSEFHVCGAPKPLEDTAFMLTKFEGNVPGTLIATRLASGNRGGLRLRVFGSNGGIEWDLEHSEYLKLSIFGEPDQIFSRGHGHGIHPNVDRLVKTGRGFPEGLIEAWANLYTEFAIAVAAKRDGSAIPAGYLSFPQLAEGADGVRVIDASYVSNEEGGNWQKI